MGGDGRGRHCQGEARGRFEVQLKTHLRTGAKDKGKRRVKGGRGSGVHFLSVLLSGEGRGRQRQDSGSGRWLGDWRRDP